MRRKSVNLGISIIMFSMLIGIVGMITTPQASATSTSHINRRDYHEVWFSVKFELWVGAAGWNTGQNQPFYGYYSLGWYTTTPGFTVLEFWYSTTANVNVVKTTGHLKVTDVWASIVIIDNWVDATKEWTQHSGSTVVKPWWWVMYAQQGGWPQPDTNMVSF